jgi:hypothetical protein
VSEKGIRHSNRFYIKPALSFISRILRLGELVLLRRRPSWTLHNCVFARMDFVCQTLKWFVVAGVKV